MTRPDILCVLGPHHPLNNRVLGWLTWHHQYAVMQFGSTALTMVEALIKHTKDKTEKREPSFFMRNPEGMKTPIPKLCDFTAPEIAQALETGLCEHLDPNFLAQVTMMRVNNFLKSKTNRNRPLLFQDSRYENEIEVVKAIGGKFLRIKMPSLPSLPPYFDKITPDFVVDVPDIERFEEIHDLMAEMFGLPDKMPT